MKIDRSKHNNGHLRMGLVDTNKWADTVADCIDDHDDRIKELEGKFDALDCHMDNHRASNDQEFKHLNDRIKEFERQLYAMNNGQTSINAEHRARTDELESDMKQAKSWLKDLDAHSKVGNDQPDTGLIPCPFCGGEIGISMFDISHDYRAMCINSQCPVKPKTGYHKTKEEAIKAINTRKGA